jgi:hypothetical protein
VPTFTPGGPTPTRVAFAPVPDLLYDEAVELARSDLAARLEIDASAIEALAPDTELFVDDPQQCPDLPEEVANETQALYFVFLQHARFIYPYQVYQADQSVIVDACADVFIDEDTLYVPTPDARQEMLARIRDDLTAQGVDVSQGQFVTIREMTWTDEALGCRLPPGQTAAPALIEGYMIVFAAGSQTYEYHTGGERIEFCVPPPGFDTIDALIDAWKKDENLEVTRARDPETGKELPARYEGLGQDGVLVEITDRGFRVGLFDFPTPAAAHDAAMLITDSSVSRIFQTGSVIIVQQENSGLIFSILLDYAQLVRVPLEERLAAQEAEDQVEEPVDLDGDELADETPEPTPEE